MRVSTEDPQVKSSAFFIPTHRDADQAIASYARELRYAREKFDRIIPLILSETNDGPNVPGNARALAALRDQDPHIPVHHLTVDVQRAFFEVVLKGESPELWDVFLGQHRDYGTAMNRIFLFACALGVEAFHRRDSDTRLLSHVIPEDAHRYPIEFELRFLGKPMSHAGAARIDTTVADQPIYVVGGNYYGEWNLDVKDFAKRSYDIIHHLYVLLGFDPEAVPGICADAFPAQQVYDPEDRLTVITSVDDGLNPDCGNVAITQLHEYLPNVPGRNMLAADYFTFDKATALGIPSLHHSRSVFHEYSSGRFEPAQKRVYWEGVANFADYFNLYRTLYTPDAAPPPPAKDQLISHETLRRMIDQVAALPAIDPGARAARIRRIAEEVLLPFDERYAELGRHLLARADHLVEQCNVDYRRHRLLLERWPELVSRAKNYELHRVLKRG